MHSSRAAMMLASFVAVGALLSGCAPSFDSPSGMDSVLWNQVAEREDPFWRDLARSSDVGSYAAALASPGSDPSDGTVAVTDVRREGSLLSFSVFISSGERRPAPSDYGDEYTGPTQIYTCFGVLADLSDPDAIVLHRELDADCPDELVGAMPPDAVFVRDDVFDG